MAEIKICGLFRPQDVDYVNEARPDYCGFILNFPKSHRSISPAQAQALSARLDREITPVGVFVNQPVDAVLAALTSGAIRVVQLHGSEDEAYIAALRARTCAPIWKAFQIRSAADLDRAAQSSADLILLDKGQGAGETFDWSLIGQLGRPFALAGGLTPENIPQALSLSPTLLDISSGVETDRKKDRKKILAAVAAARQLT